VAKAGGTLESVATTGEALKRLKAASFALVLPNRVIGLDEQGGESLVRRMKEDPELAEIPVMLVSAVETAQQAAEAAGAEPGFGKDQLGTNVAAERISRYLSPAGGG
jgi:CheY-like chemotaxis protein